VAIKTAAILFACVSVVTQAATADCKAETDRLFKAIRAGDRAALNLALKNGADVNGRDKNGSTPLMYAAFYLSDTAALRQLLDQGANPNVANESGATALIWGTGSLEKVKLLVEHGADVQTRSKLGKTALLVAASRDGAGPVVSYLLAHGANTDVTDSLSGLPPLPVGGGGATALIQAAKARDGEALAALLKKGVDVNAKKKNGSTALLNAIANHNHRNAEMLITNGADLNASNAGGFSPLIMAAMRDDFSTAAALVAKGAKVDAEDQAGNTALMWAAYSERGNSEIVSLLLKHRANPDHKNKLGETASTWAARRGDTKIVAFLDAGDAAPVKDQIAPSRVNVSSDRQNLFAAIDKSLPLLQKAGPAVFKQRGCISCHNNMLPTMTAIMARNQGHKIDEAAIEHERKTMLSIIEPALELFIENGDNIPDVTVTAPYALMTLAALEYPADMLTDAAVHNLANKQNADGSWTVWAPRPPIEYGDIQTTALCIRALQLYPLNGRRAEFETRIRAARQWLLHAKPETSSDLNWRTLGLFWSKADPRPVVHSALQILSNQRADGGWAQLPGLGSDAYATGQTLYVFGVTHALDRSSDTWKRGTDYLLRTQAQDGTWRVKSRSFPFQPYFESGFPYGPDQWISVAGTSWATMALTLGSSENPAGKSAEELTASLQEQ
jgi:ankyrin repeat protein